ncbi:MAG: nitrogen regulation protein NR(II) [Calditrichaceae bacterium]
MSKRFESKKEAASRINKILAELEGNQPNGEVHDTLKKNYDILLKRYGDLEKIFRFHKGIIQNISSGIFTIDMNGYLTFLNRAALDILEYSSDEILGKKVEVLFEDENQINRIIRQIVDEKALFESKEAELVSGNGKMIPIGFSTTLLKQSDDHTFDGIIFIFRDITYITTLRKQIERMDRLATLGELAAGIAHEIRNPLAGIKASAQVLEDSYNEDDFRTQLVTRIVKEIDRSNELLKRFFNFARPNKPKQDFHDIENIIDGVYLLMASRFKKQKIRYSTNFSEIKHKIFADESQIEQVILNLFINAAEAMPNGGDILVEVGETDGIRLSENQHGHSVVYVRIKDSGPGIPVEKHEKIFNPFYTTKADGVGLGLSISTRLLEENNGKIEIQSRQGEGAVFSIYLPVVINNKTEQV